MTPRSKCRRWALTLCFWVLMPGAAHAACTNPTDIEGAIIYNAAQNVPQVCAGNQWVALGALNPGAGSGVCSNPTDIEGAIVYNNDHDVLQYCNGEYWIAVQAAPAGTGTCASDPACPNVGDVCGGDGSGGGNPKFAGCLCYHDANSEDVGTCKAVYATQGNQSLSTQWKTSTGVDDIATDSEEDGKINDGQVPNSTNFPAFKLCKDLTDGGYTDWYLPARTELDLLWRNRTAIGSFTVDTYWPSTEEDTIDSWRQLFSDGSQNNGSKNSTQDVRCVRRD